MLLLDGFDEIVPSRWFGGATDLKTVRWEALSPVRRLVTETPAGSGIIVAGRSHYFSGQAEMVSALEGEIDALEAGQEMPAEFILPGESMTGAALDLARSTVRRAERRTVALAQAGELPSDSQVLPYLNRLADLLFVMARAADGGFTPVNRPG